jgi:hypothetical protein
MVNLTSRIEESSWFYKDNEELCKPHLGKPYVSYSTVQSWFEYRSDFIKEKLAKIPQKHGIYKSLGSYIGEAIEKGYYPEDNIDGFIGQNNLDLDKVRPPNGEYEKMIIIDRGEWVIIGFIDIYSESENGDATVFDVKSGGAKKEDYYKSLEYIQVILYAYAMEILGKQIKKTGVYFIRREGSHVKPPLKIGLEQFVIPLEYTEERVKFALDKVDKAVKEITEFKNVFDKYFT